MNYIKITKNDIANGPGIRVVLWVAGCEHRCKGCHNPHTLNPNSGYLYTDVVLGELLTALQKPYVKGLTFSGGDPLHKNNIRDIRDIIIRVKNDYPEKDIWLYTGYKVEDINNSTDQNMLIRKENLSLCDVVVDGRYEESKRNILLPWCGSSNQRVIDINKSKTQNKIVLYKS